MRYKAFGTRTGLRVSEYALGTGRLADSSEAESVVKGFVEEGGNFFDLSDAYQKGESERLVGRVIADDRNDFVLLSKYTRSAEAKPAIGNLGNSRKVMVQAVEGSLRRLNTDRIDIYLAHVDDEITPIEEVARGFDDLARAGKIIYAGLSNFPAWRVATAATLADLRGWLPISAIEVEYSLVERTAERELLPMAQALGLGVLGYSPLAAGLLTAKQRQGGASRGAASDQTKKDGHEALLDTVTEVATELMVEPALVALAWVSAKGVLPIIGVSNCTQLKENLAASSVHLSPQHIDSLDKVTAFSLGYPHDLVKSESTRKGLTGGHPESVEWPRSTIR